MEFCEQLLPQPLAVLPLFDAALVDAQVALKLELETDGQALGQLVRALFYMSK